MGECGMSELDPAVEHAYRRLMDATDRLSTARLRSQQYRHGDWDKRTDVDEQLMWRLADDANASNELREYADRVRSGECAWSEIESKLPVLPREIQEMKASPNFWWPWSSPEPIQVHRPQREPGVIGPNDWPDDFEDYPTDRPWWGRK